MCSPAGEVRQLREKQCPLVFITLRSTNIQKELYFNCALSGKSNFLDLVAQQQRSDRSGREVSPGQSVRRYLSNSSQVGSFSSESFSDSFQERKSKQSLGRR